MHTPNLLTPWITFAVILLPLIYLERWIHKHLYGVGWLLTQDKERATILYYLILLPGVFLHEFTQWLMAGALDVKTSKIKVWPRPQKDGTLRFDFVKVRKTTRFRATVIGIVPLLSGIGIALFMQSIPDALATGDLPVVLAEFRRLLSTPDFWLWLYLLFAIGNAMMPTPSDRQDWPLLAGIFAVVSVFLVAIGLGEEVLVPTLQGPIARILGILVTAFGSILVLDVFVVLGLGLLERALERVTGKRAKYPGRSRSRSPKPVPGGEIPLPDNQAPEAIVDRRLPIPPAPQDSEPTTPMELPAQQTSMQFRQISNSKAEEKDTIEEVAQEDTVSSERQDTRHGGPPYDQAVYVGHPKDTEGDAIEDTYENDYDDEIEYEDIEDIP